MKPMVVINTTPIALSRTRQLKDGSESRGGDSCYFPGCRKDTNCNCDICLDSFNATRDLLPCSSSITKNSPFDVDTMPMSPEVGSTATPSPTPIMRSTAKCGTSKKREKAVGFDERGKSGVRGVGWGGWVLGVILGFGLIWGLDWGFSERVLGEYGPRLSVETVERIGEECRAFDGDLKGKMVVLRERMEGLIGGRVSDCGAAEAIWELNQEGQFLFQWRCVIYKSMAEKVSIWGSPLRTSGLLATGCSTRSLTLLSGKIIEWSDGRLLSTVRSNNSSSWTYQKWSSAALQLDPNTWILDYEMSALFQQSRIVHAAWEILKACASKKLKRMKQYRLGRLVNDALHGYHYRSYKRRVSNPPT